jgi:serine phosphatase RsbU (regulator of sigma subunit)
MASEVFDSVVLQTQEGPRVLSMAEFAALPLPERVGYILRKEVTFRAGDTAVGQRVALDTMVREAVHRAAYEAEMSVARRIQTSLLPREVAVEGLDVSARMVPATEVGGDYYDVVPVERGCWLGIGDVAGHGVSAAIVMLALQSAVATSIRVDPAARPRDLICALNDVLYDCIQGRLRSDEHVTCTLLRFTPDGRFAFAGAHEDILVYRAASRRIDRIPTAGTWLGCRRGIADVTAEGAFTLQRGDLLILHTDGITEALAPGGVLFDADRLCDAILASAGGSAASVCDRVFEAVSAWTPHQADDRTLLVCRYAP